MRLEARNSRNSSAVYKAADYWKFGTDFVSTHLFKRPRLSVLMLYATTRCQSRCKTCNIWQKEHVDLPLDVIKRTLQCGVVDRRTRIGLEGGEVLLHPEFDQILDFLATGGYNFELLTNGLMPRRLEEAVRTFRVPRVYLSLDGGPETYNRVRGVDSYDQVLESIRRVKELAPVSIMYLINPWNGQEDLEHVAGLCREHDLDLRVGIYNNIQFFETTRTMDAIEYSEKIRVDVSDFSENQEFLDLYDQWQAGKVILPCLSIRQELVVYPNGAVPLCQNKHIVLGNVHRQSLDEILADPVTRTLQQENLGCNGCWINFHRKFDLAVCRWLRYLPGSLTRPFVGEVRWPSGGAEASRK